MRPLCAVLACAVALGPLMGAVSPAMAQHVAVAPAEAVSERPEGVTVVVYRDQPVDTVQLMSAANNRWARPELDGLALIVEKRVIEVPADDGVVRFKGLATGIIPHSATIEGLPADLLEQNADYDLISPQSLLANSVGQAVTVVRTNTGNGAEVQEQGIIRSGQNGVVLEINGKFEALDCSGLTERLVFDDVPEGLGATPTLSIKTRAEEAGRYEITLAYLASGLQWSADYIARLSDNGRTVNLEGWITLANFGGTSFADAPVVVVAGDLSRNADTRPIQLRARGSVTQCWPQGQTHQIAAQPYGIPPPPPPPPAPAPPPPPPMSAMRQSADEIVVTGSRVKAKQEDLGDYKAYVLPHLTTVAARQTKQVLFLAQDDIPAERVMVANFRPAEINQPPYHAALQLRLQNTQAAGLGLPVPEGKVAFYVEGEEAPMDYAGEEQVSDTPVGLPIRLTLHTVPEVTSKVWYLHESVRGRGDRRRRVETYRVTLANSLDEAVDVEMPNDWMSGEPGYRLERETLRSQIDSDTGLRVWKVRLEAGTERTFDVRWSYDYPE